MEGQNWILWGAAADTWRKYLEVPAKHPPLPLHVSISSSFQCPSSGSYSSTFPGKVQKCLKPMWPKWLLLSKMWDLKQRKFQGVQFLWEQLIYQNLNLEKKTECIDCLGLQVAASSRPRQFPPTHTYIHRPTDETGFFFILIFSCFFIPKKINIHWWIHGWI